MCVITLAPMRFKHTRTCRHDCITDIILTLAVRWKHGSTYWRCVGKPCVYHIVHVHVYLLYYILMRLAGFLLAQALVRDVAVVRWLCTCILWILVLCLWALRLLTRRRWDCVAASDQWVSYTRLSLLFAQVHSCLTTDDFDFIPFGLVF